MSSEGRTPWVWAVSLTLALVAHDRAATPRTEPPGTAAAGSRSASPDELFLEEAKLAASDGEDSDRFGVSVAVSGNRVAVGAPLDDGPGGVDQGSVYLFEQEAGGDWVETVKLTASDGAGGDHFGAPVRLDGERLAVGHGSGSAYLFERDPGGEWTEEIKLKASDGNGMKSLAPPRQSTGISSRWELRSGIPPAA